MFPVRMTMSRWRSNRSLGLQAMSADTHSSDSDQRVCFDPALRPARTLINGPRIQVSLILDFAAGMSDRLAAVERLVHDAGHRLWRRGRWRGVPGRPHEASESRAAACARAVTHGSGAPRMMLCSRIKVSRAPRREALDGRGFARGWHRHGSDRDLGRAVSRPVRAPAMLLSPTPARGRVTGFLLAGATFAMVETFTGAARLRPPSSETRSRVHLDGQRENSGRPAVQDVEFRIADTFTASLARLNGTEQKAAKTTRVRPAAEPVEPRPALSSARTAPRPRISGRFASTKMSA